MCRRVSQKMKGLGMLVRACHKSMSLCSLKVSRLLRTVPPNSDGLETL